jgi:hypothetical protein
MDLKMPIEMMIRTMNPKRTLLSWLIQKAKLMALRIRIGMTSLKMVPEGKSSSWCTQKAWLMDLKMETVTDHMKSHAAILFLKMQVAMMTMKTDHDRNLSF